MAPVTGTDTSNLGFLTVIREPGGYLGGYLVTNQWGRPLEFRLSTPVQPNRVQQILYAETLEPYVCGDLIGKTLVDKTASPVRAVITDTAAALDLRQRLDCPVLLLSSPREGASMPEKPPLRQKPEMALRGHGRFPDDAWIIQELLDRAGEGFDLAEPFARVREAMAEARKMGVTTRA